MTEGTPPSESCDLSIIVPAFNEEQRLPRAIKELGTYMDTVPCRAEALIVENGSTDGTAEIADRAAAEDERFRVLHVSARGKGRAVRSGMLAGRGEILVFCDADFSMPIDGVSGLRATVLDGADVAIASREARGARRIGEPWGRHLQGRVFNWLVQLMALPGLQDTQCGFKAFRREVARDLFCRQVLNGWAFDVEVLFLARQQGYSIREVPITWWYDPSSRVSVLTDTIAMFRELVTIRWNALHGRYG